MDSKNNPADLCSRGIQAQEKEKWTLYLEGPEFLRGPVEQWPRRPQNEDVAIASMTEKEGGQGEAEEEAEDVK